MDSNLDEAPTISKKDLMKQELEKKCKIDLDKYFEGREYQSENVTLWKDYALEGLNDFLKKNYEEFGFALFMIVIKKGDVRIDSNSIARSKTDSFVKSSVETKSMYAYIKIWFYKLYNIDRNIFDSFNEELVLKMNNIIASKLEGKQYSYEFINSKVTEIVNDLQKFLLIPNDKLCSFHICCILRKPIEYQFACKAINLNYIPLTASYSNDSLNAQLILFILKN